MSEEGLRVPVKKLAIPDHWRDLVMGSTPAAVAETPPPAPLVSEHHKELTPPSDILTALPVRIPIAHSTRILIAEDDSVSRRVLAQRLLNWGFEPIITRDGHEATEQMRAPNPPQLAILDWMMPGMDGVEACRRVRATNKRVYIIMLTALKESENISEALNAGADDYVVKPFAPLELQARINVGLRVIGLQSALVAQVAELENSLAELRAMKGGDALNLPI